MILKHSESVPGNVSGSLEMELFVAVMLEMENSVVEIINSVPGFPHCLWTIISKPPPHTHTLYLQLVLRAGQISTFYAIRI